MHIRYRLALADTFSLISLLHADKEHRHSRFRDAEQVETLIHSAYD
jgi:hypothetical protein